MLKTLVGLLVVLNLGFLAWRLGSVDHLVGWRSTGDREPERLARQVRPDTVRVLPASGASAAVTGTGTGGARSTGPAAGASEAASAASSASSPAGMGAASNPGLTGAASDGPARCLEAGPFADHELDAARAAVRTIVPGDGAEAVRVDRPAVWTVYMGRYPAAAGLQRKEEELNRRNVAYEVLTAPQPLAPGLALGRYADRAAADRAFVELGRQGVRTGRVTQLEPAGTEMVLRVPQADPPTARRLQALVRDPAMGGKAFGGCVTRP